jgi:phosphoribosyl 1,2-cyclic phosphodiesterase
MDRFIVAFTGETSSGFRSNCYWTDWNRANTENIRIGLVLAVLAQ